MNSFTLNVCDASGSREFKDVTSFVGEDASGSFGILAGHARMVTALVIGLARFRTATGAQRYLALPGAILYFRDNLLSLASRLCLVDEDYTRITEALSERLLAEEQTLRSTKESLRRMEEEVLRRLWEMGRQAG